MEGTFASGRVVDGAGEFWEVSDAGGARSGDRVLLQPLGGKGSAHTQRGEVLQGVDGPRAGAW